MNVRRVGHRSPARAPALACAAALWMVAAAMPQQAGAQAHAWVPGKGHGAVTLALGSLFVKDHLSFSGSVLRPGDITDQIAYLGVDYGLTDQLAISLSIPYINKKYEGNRPHNPRLLDDPALHDLPFLDDGNYHGSWQDYTLQLRYNLWAEPFAITPHLTFTVPSHDYPFFAQAAVGTQQSTVQVGVDVGHAFEPPWQDFYFQAGYTYVFVEQERGINVDRSMLDFELGYLLRPGLIAKVLAVAQKTHGGLDFPIDFRSFRDDQWFHHDQIQRTDYLNLGMGLDYQLNPEWSVAITYGKTTWGENTYEIRRAVTVGVSRAF